ncbi:hypothetical protein KUTeg_022751 [Tegillarca granosa]|uniref:Ferritin n=1 Tax=Tegillarca granosa TaxID=220873 RepID=A0ABQ9E4N2_TEGGR|nr:hypothetical protein KUTeg_022751 [Tegillarca granosa]
MHPGLDLAYFLVFCPIFEATKSFKLNEVMAQTQPRQNFTAESEAGINKQINLELYASYVYQSMAMYFDRDDVALPGFSKFFKHNSDEEREHAEKFMKYQNKRGGRIVLQNIQNIQNIQVIKKLGELGGRIVLQNIQKPERDEWGSGLEAMQAALTLEKNVNQSLLDLHKVAESQNDVHLGDFLESEYLEEQVESIKQLSDYVTMLKRVGPGLGEYQFDKETLGC